MALLRSSHCAAAAGAASRPSVLRAPVVVAPARRVACRAEKDAMKMAADLLGAGLNALKQVDSEKVKGAAGDLKSTAVSAANFSVGAVQSCVDTALGVWAKYDADGDGKLTISEACNLLNSPEVSEAVTKATGLGHTVRTPEDIQKWFARADFDNSGSLSKREFLVMYIGLLAHKAKLGAGGLASALCSVLDSDGDGKIESSELKRLLKGSGLSVIANVANLIPDGKNVDYRSLLSKIA